MIQKVVIRRFKRFQEETFNMPSHIVLAGPNNSGKTTVLQAIAAWSLALGRWKELNDFWRHGGAYPKAPIARQAFSAVPLRSFDLLWRDREYYGPVEIEIQSNKGWTVTMELLADSTEQIYVRPTPSIEPDALRSVHLNTVFIPPMTGLGTDEPVYTRPKQDQLLGQAKPGDIIRNLLVEAHHSNAWGSLTESIKRLFRVDLLPPNADGPHIVSEFGTADGTRLDIASAGSGFQQVLMLLTFLHTRPASVLLIDEPDAHLHVILQDSIYSELQSVAAKENSKLIIATHSEVIINSVPPEELCMLFHSPKRLANSIERTRLAQSLGVLSQTDVMLALESPGVLYLEGHTDLNILREWARILNHPVNDYFTRNLFWKPTVWQNRADGPGVSAQKHYEAACLVREDLPGLILLDSDAKQRVPVTNITGQGLQRVAWQRYETESYLVHPAVLERFIERKVGPAEMSAQARADGMAELQKLFGSKELLDAFAANPHKPPAIVENYLRTTKARTEIIAAILQAAGIHGFDYTHYHEIAEVMEAEEIHPEVKEKLDAIQRALRL
jgi:DNA polymerase III delta prime subunit